MTATVAYMNLRHQVRLRKPVDAILNQSIDTSSANVVTQSVPCTRLF
jgi:hypothetical protein